MKRLLTLQFFFAIIFFLLIHAFSFAQNTSSIQGTISAQNGAPASFIPVELKTFHKTVLSDEDGNFLFENLPELTDSLVISSLQFKYYAVPVHVCCGNILKTGNIILQENIKALQDIEIKGMLSSSYKNNYSFVATKKQSNIKDVPQTISVVSSQLIKDRMDYSLNDVIENIAGVNLFSDYQEYTIRGFRAENPRLINGLRTYNSSLVPPLLANIERVEVIKGPAAVLYGNNDPGGIINMVTKKPLPEKFYEVSAGFGSWNDKRLSADVSGPVNSSHSFLYRFNTAYKNSSSFRNQLFNKSIQLAPSFSFAPNEKLSLNFDFSFAHTNTVADRGVPGFNNDRIYIQHPSH